MQRLSKSSVEIPRNTEKSRLQIQKDDEISRLQIQIDEYKNRASVVEKKIKAASDSMLLRQSAEKFQKQRNSIALMVALRRAEAIVGEGGALNYFEQMKPLKERFLNDFIAAWLRLSAAAEGFANLYNYPVDEKVFSAVHNEPETEITSFNTTIENFDDLVSWCQYTNNWLASFTDTQQQITRSFSLKELVGGEAEFEECARNSKWSFKLTEQDFPDMNFVRMRSLAIQIFSGEKSGSWNVSITPPLRAKNSPHIQEHIGTLYLGRVNERAYAVSPEGTSPPKLFNGSPIGEDSEKGNWNIEILSASTSGVKVEDIKDIDIHLTVAIV
jgi:hypothetical protein